MATKIWILHSEFIPEMFDEGDESCFLGAHTSLEKAQAFASAVAEADRVQWNLDREEGEAEMPSVVLEWKEARKDTANRPVLQSDTLELGSGAFYFEVTQSSLDPTL
jgi:hypothetical protein